METWLIFMAASNGGSWHVVKDLEPFLDWCVARGKLTREEADMFLLQRTLELTEG